MQNTDKTLEEKYEALKKEYNICIKEHEEKTEEANALINQLKNTIEKQKGLTALKSKFITVVSHQLRTPLNGMRWNLEMFISGDLGELEDEQKNFLWLTYEINQKLLNTLQDILLALEIEEKDLFIDSHDTYLIELVRSVVNDFEHDINSKDHRVTVRKEIADLPPMKLDQAKITEILKKLLDNAIKYTPENGKICLNAKIKNDSVIFCIKDNGVGIPKGAIDKIFTKFFRASNASTMYPDASGLGLFISNAYIEAMNGKMWLKTAEGKGTTIFFEIPFLISDLKK